MKKILFLLLFTAPLISTMQGQTISIAAARALPLGSVVTVAGIVTNGPGLGVIRYIQDGTGGIALFSTMLSSTLPGDLITVTGVTDDYFNLLELNPVGWWSLNSSGNPLPVPVHVTPSQLSEPNESQVIQINNVTFSNPGGIFAGNATLSFSAGGQPGEIYLRSGNPIVGTLIPSGMVTLTGICSQNNSTYQVLPRDTSDMTSSGSIYFTSQPAQINNTTAGFDIAWQTNTAGSSTLEYGSTPSLGNLINGAGATTNHVLSITGATASQLFYARVYSVAGTDTVFSGIEIFMTASGSGGVIKTYFNRSVDHNVASTPSNQAFQLNNTIDDTLKAYIDRCQNTLDIAIYNFDNNNTGAIIQAINDAYNRGVQIRIISDGSNNNSALASLNSNIPKLSSPTLPAGYYGFMHNKFVIMDAGHPNPDLPVVWTGATNWSNDQLYTDANNVIIIQDKSLALTYTMEFEEMWGSNGSLPDSANSKFGPDKTNNTPHEFLIGGKRVECYFSPSDHVNYKLINTINSADGQLFFATFVFTRYDIAFAVEDRVINGVLTAGIIDDSSNGGGYAYSIMQSVMGNKLEMYDHGSLPGILHHKYMIIDQHHVALDPLVWTGSHNWSNSANTRNDENTVIVHDADVANQYYQEFYKRFTESGGTIGIAENSSGDKIPYIIYPNPAMDELFISCGTTLNKPWDILLTDVCGKTVAGKNRLIKGGTNHIKIDLSDVSPGIYFLTFRSKNIIKTEKILVQ